MNKLGIEYSHIYTDQSFNDEQLEGIKKLKKIEKKIKKENSSVSRVILIDDYSPPITFNRFDFDNFFKQLQSVDAVPDVIVKESEILKYCQATLDLINDNKIGHKLRTYVYLKNKFPCSLFIAAWYLLRLGAFGQVKVNCVYGNSSKIFSERIITILPDSYTTPENNASEIINTTKFKNLNKKIERIFFYYLKPQYSNWDEFDPYEYVERNYGKKILLEDKKIIEYAIKKLREFGVAKKSFQLIADVGAGPNLYPSMLLSPFVSDKGIIELLDISKPNLEYLRNLLTGSEEKNNWIKFDKFIYHYGGQMYKNNLDRTLKLIDVKVGSIEALSKEKYDAVMCFFATEGIYSKIEKFKKAIHKLIAATKKGGLVITAHMLNSKGYYAGERTSFPSVSLTLADLKQEFSELEKLTINLITCDNQKSVRLGYNGMALVIGKKP